MLLETLFALAALATVLSFVFEAFDRIRRFMKRRSAQRMEREEASNSAPENE